MSMDVKLVSFLGTLTPIFNETVTWGQAPLEVATYWTRQLPPLDFVTSVRAIIFSSQCEVLICSNADGERHIVPGGRRESGEELTQTLEREVVEETGWLINNIKQIGLWHFHHLAPKLPHYKYPYPDFLNILYRADAVREDKGAKIIEDYELESKFVPITALSEVNLEQPSQRVLMKRILSEMR